MSYAKKKTKRKKTTVNKAIARDKTAGHPDDAIRTSPTLVVQTVRGPVIGKVIHESANEVWLYGPAHVQMTSPTKVVFLPVGFCESFIQFFKGGLMGINTAPAALVQGYGEYLESFLAGAYRMQIIDAKIEAETVSVNTAPVASTELMKSATDHPTS